MHHDQLKQRCLAEFFQVMSQSHGPFLAPGCVIHEPLNRVFHTTRYTFLNNVHHHLNEEPSSVIENNLFFSYNHLLAQIHAFLLTIDNLASTKDRKTHL